MDVIILRTEKNCSQLNTTKEHIMDDMMLPECRLEGTKRRVMRFMFFQQEKAISPRVHQGTALGMTRVGLNGNPP